MSYFEQLTSAMTLLAQDERTIFLGQCVEYPGNALYKTFSGVPAEKKLEMPVAEDAQLGLAIGMSLAGKIPIAIYPRFDFLLLATNQLVNHLDKMVEFSHGEFHPKVIIRVAVGATKPLYPGVQHCGDYTEVFRQMLRNVNVYKLTRAAAIVPEYRRALESSKSTLLIEMCDLYDV